MDAMGIKSELRKLPARNEVLHAHSDHEKAQRILGIHTETPLSEGLQKMAEWVKRSGVRKSSRFKDIEILEKLPQVWLED